MKLHGIELAKPDEWCISICNDCSCRVNGFIHWNQVDGRPVRLRGYEFGDWFLHKVPSIGWAVSSGMTGARLCHASSIPAAKVTAIEALEAAGPVRTRNILIGVLDVARLSPRYRWTGGG